MACFIVKVFGIASIFTLGVIISSTIVSENSKIDLSFSCSSSSIHQFALHISRKLCISSQVIVSAFFLPENIFIIISIKTISG
jgi:hypothetical protein